MLFERFFHNQQINQNIMLSTLKKPLVLLYLFSGYNTRFLFRFYHTYTKTGLQLLAMAKFNFVLM